MTSETKVFILFEIMFSFLSLYLSFYFIHERKRYYDVDNVNEIIFTVSPMIVIKNNIEIKVKKEKSENVIEIEDDIEWLEKITQDINGEQND